MLNDKLIRKAIISNIKRENRNHEYRIINELTICDGDARVDIAVANGRLCGYEIKSDVDTLERLPKQIEYYSTTFDKMTIVVGEKYNEKILCNVPDWWGIKLAYLNKNGSISIRNIRTAKINKNLDAHKITQLLWKEELQCLLRCNEIKITTNMSRLKLRDIASTTIPLKEIKKFTLETIKYRENWRAV